jgi:alkylation response protein AidB-like acyl-CoA dehydrogenase
MSAIITRASTTLYEHEHELFRESCRAFLQQEVLPHADAWRRDMAPRELFEAAAAKGFLAMAAPERHGGAGVEDFRFSAILREESAYAEVVPLTAGVTLHNDICLPYFLGLATAEQRERWLPGIAAGRLVTAVAMTEPAAGSDLQGIKTRAVRDGDGWTVNGSKTFITNGVLADLVITVVKTDPAAGARGLSLLVLERGMAGFERGENLEMIGMHGHDTAELFFDDVRVPAENLLGVEGRGFHHLMANLPQERMSIAIDALACAEAALNWTVEHVRERTAFGRPIGAFQNSRFTLAECLTEVCVTRAFVEDCIRRLNAGALSGADAAMAKWWATDVQGRVIDRCLQLFGGYGYMAEYPIARAYTDARVMRIFGGANEVMKEIVGRSMDLGEEPRR